MIWMRDFCNIFVLELDFRSFFILDVSLYLFLILHKSNQMYIGFPLFMHGKLIIVHKRF